MEDGPDTIADGGPQAPVEDSREEAAALIGVDVGGYVIDGELGRGGMGVVFSATHPVIGKRAAIKVLRPALSNNPATVERFVQEARLVNQIGHPNIVDIFAYGTLPDGRSYLVMDLLQGESLRKRVKRGPLLVGDAIHVLDDVASALAAAHDKGFIHRDLKPDNVFLVERAGRTECKLLDFGLAKLLPTATLSRTYRTATGAQLGTPDYMSPEQLKGPDGVDTRTDIFALGVLAFEILVGERPRRHTEGTFALGGKTISETIFAKAKPPNELAQLVEAMVARDKETRPSLAAVRTVLKRARTAVPSTSVIGLEVDIPPVKANVATPPSGVPTVVEVPRDRPPSQPPNRGSQPSLRPSTPALSPSRAQSQPRPNQVRASDAETNPGTVSSRPSSPSLSANSAAGLRPAASRHGGTKLGVAPPGERPSKPHPVASRAMTGQSSGGGRTWLIVGVVLVLVSAVALVLVLVQ